MFDMLMIGLLLLAIAIGYGLGVYRYTRRTKASNSLVRRHYYQGLQYLLNEQADNTIDSFIESLEVNTDTLEIHLALGNHLRRQGEVTKAIKIHEHLLQCGKLTQLQFQQAQLELANDYVNAGLLDRAEDLFAELVSSKSRYSAEALEHLMVIYQNEGEWSKAIQAANSLSVQASKIGTYELAMMAAHYSCELAQQALERQELAAASDHLQEAFRYHQHSVRASLLSAQIQFDKGAYREALIHLKKIPLQDPELIKESLSLLKQCAIALGDMEGLRHYLFSLLTRYPSNSVIISLAEVLAEREGQAAATEFIVAQLRKRPSLRTLNYLIDLYLGTSDGKARENLILLKSLIDNAMLEKPSYICSKCGFTGHKLHWLCPSCKSWSSIKPIKGVLDE